MNKRPKIDKAVPFVPAIFPAGEPGAAVRVITPTPFVWRNPATIPRRQWLYGKHYIRKFISATFAAGGLGKTSLALVEAVAMATGRPLLGVPVPKRLRVWYWNGEDPAEETERRLAAILLHFKIPREEVEGWLFTDTGREMPICIAQTLKNSVVFTPDAPALTASIIANKIDVFICDPFVKTHGVAENDNGAIDGVATSFARAADQANCAVELTHHVRKAGGTGRSEVSADDGRGAGALKDAARAVRVANVMASAEAPVAQVQEKDRKRYFRVDDDGKANMAPPAESATWYKIISVPLYNDPEDPNAFGDSIGVAVSWKMPGTFDDRPNDDLPKVQAALAAGDCAKDARATKWAGRAIAGALDIDITEREGRAKIEAMLKAWIKSGVLLEKIIPNKRTGREQVIIVAEMSPQLPQSTVE
jgi:AAA domain